MAVVARAGASRHVLSEPLAQISPAPPSEFNDSTLGNGTRDNSRHCGFVPRSWVPRGWDGPMSALAPSRHAEIRNQCRYRG